MNICFTSSELTPYAKVGGLADVSAALPVALQNAGHQLKVVLPLYRDLNIDRTQLVPYPKLTDIQMTLGPIQLTLNGYQYPFPGKQETHHSPELILLNCESLYHRDGIYGEQDDEFLRFLVLSRGAIEVCQHLQWRPDVFHCNDWQTALIPLLLKTVYGWDNLFHDTKTILTIHNIGHQGVFPATILPYLNLTDSQHLLHQDDLNDRKRINYLKTGILYANKITCVSPTYAQEIQTPAYGAGLEDLLQGRKRDLVGILNGIDTQEWNPEADPLIPAPYSAKNLKPKRLSKKKLLEEMNVSVNLQVPTIGIVSRLASQKGFDLMMDVLPGLLEQHDIRLVILGSGQEKYVDFFTAVRRRFPEKVGFYHGFSNELAHLIEAGSDIFLMPSQYEPCGLNQMYSQAYGTVPIVRKTGGLADTVQHYDPRTGTGTGVVFEHYTSTGLEWALLFALNLFDEPQHWHQIVTNGMRQDFSWLHQAQKYSQLYAQLQTSK